MQIMVMNHTKLMDIHINPCIFCNQLTSIIPMLAMSWKNRFYVLCPCHPKRWLGWHQPSKTFFWYDTERRLGQAGASQAFFRYDNNKELKIEFTAESDMGVAQGCTNFQKLLCITVIHLPKYRTLHTLVQQGMPISSDSMGHLHLGPVLYDVAPGGGTPTANRWGGQQLKKNYP